MCPLKLFKVTRNKEILSIGNQLLSEEANVNQEHCSLLANEFDYGKDEDNDIKNVLRRI